MKVTSKPAGKFAVKGGKGHMAGNTGSSKQKSGTTSPTKGSKARSFGDKPDGGPDDKMAKFAGVKAQKPGITSVR